MASGTAASGASPAVPPPAPGGADGSAAPGAAVPAADHSTAADALTRYLQSQATAFLRGLGLRGEGDGTWDTLLRGSARRIAGVLHTYGPLTDEAWAEPFRAELGWLSATLGREPQYSARLDRLLEALRRLSAAGAPEAPGGAAPAASAGPLALGAARAAALLERQLTLARTRAHSATLQALGSSRFHALADAVAVLASDVPLTAAAAGPAGVVLAPLAAQAHKRLADAAAALPLNRAALPYNAEAVQAALGTELTTDLQDAPWHQVRILLRLSRYAAEVTGAGPAGDPVRTADAGRLLQQHHEAAESASAVAAAARTPRIAPATAYALGVLHADQRHEVEAARFAFSRLWQSGQPQPLAPLSEPAEPARAAAVPGARAE
ncbi:CHAD domain-containing protein [Actinacidiphila rubida]|uniref:CHAD domain-containing protein n=1 Tax=Actinacidiphila rubida TaxID=310780 RepID=UPI0009A0C4D5